MPRERKSNKKYNVSATDQDEILEKDCSKEKILGKLDRYDLIKDLGRGTYGHVFLARDTEAGINVALKALNPEIAARGSDEEFRKIQKNFQLLFNLKHPHIASLNHLHKLQDVNAAVMSDLNIPDCGYLVVMEYVEGKSLDEFIADSPELKVSVDTALDVCRKISEGMDYAHSQNIIHRDLKSENIKITKDGQNVKILDFGMAAQASKSKSGTFTQKKTDKEKKYEVCGTYGYMAPEQWVGKKYGPYTDQYALAVIFYEMVSGMIPFQSAFDTENMAIMLNVVKTEIPETLSQLSKKQNQVLLQALSKAPKDRYASCSDFIKALGGGKVKKQKTSNGDSSFGKVAAIFVLLAVLGCGGYFGYDAYRKSAHHI